MCKQEWSKKKLAVVRVVSTVEECSGGGGTHVTFQIDGQRELAHGGGHEDWLFLTTGAYFVVELLPVREQPNRADGWCLAKLPVFAYETANLVEARDLDDARRLMAGLHESSACCGALERRALAPFIRT